MFKLYTAEILPFSLIAGMQMYYVSKTLAEQAAMQFAKENRMEVVSILPVIVAGPWLTTGVPASVDVTMSLITGLTNLIPFLLFY